MAIPVLVGVLPAVDAGATETLRRRPSSSVDTRHDTGCHRTTRRPVLPDGHESLVGELEAARVGGDATARSVAQVRHSRTSGSGKGAVRVLHVVGARRQSATARTD